ncbi:MAG: ABC transporter permease [Bacteroidetes bacterium CG2_30_33_31]|nr:MAG: ABC transporter permease [Bacteroidetes bacterium CG2_30_33_31]
MNVSEIKLLLHKDIKLELKQSYTLNSILLYAFSTVFICYLSFKGVVDVSTWNALFWIILLFTSINAVVKSFVQESPARHLYYFTLSSPQSVIISKIIYNSLLMLIITTLTFLFYIFYIGNQIDNYPLYFAALIFGSLGFASLLTMVAAISSRSNNNFGMMAILSFPIIMPMLITVIIVSKMALIGAKYSPVAWQYIGILALLNMIVIILAYLLFPYLWRE